MEKNYVVKNAVQLVAIAGFALVIGFLIFGAMLPDGNVVQEKTVKRPSINVSEVSYRVAVGKPETALFEGPTTQASIKASSELTVYNQNLALVKDVRKMRLEKGVNEVRFTDVASGIDATSVRFSDLTFKDTGVLEQSYQYDLVSTQKILEKYLDKEIMAQAQQGQGAGAKEYKGKLLGYNDGLVLQTADGIVTLKDYSNVSFQELPEGLLTKPTLVWKVYTESAGERDTETAYLTSGLDWRADYVAVANEKDDAISFSGWTTITNNSGTSYPDTKLKLVAGDVHRVQESPRYAEAYDYAVKSGAAAPQQFGTQALFEYYLYTLDRRTDIRNNETKQISLLEAPQVPVKKEYVYEPNKHVYYYNGGDTSKKVEVRLNFKNSEAQGLGVPLPKGTVRVYKKDSDGQLQFIGEDSIDHTKKEDDLDLFLGNAFDITGEKVQVSMQEISKGLRREEYKVTFENQKDEAVKVKFKEHLYGSWSITKSSQEYEKKSSTEADFIVDVPAKGKAEVTYTVEYRSYY